MDRRFYYKKAVILLIAFVMCLPTLVVPISVNAEAAQPVGSYLAERWSNSIEGGVAAKPVIAEDGTLYILSEKGKLYAFSPAGKQLWTAEVRSLDGKYQNQEGQLELGADGGIYVGSSGNLYAFQTDGVKKWEYEMPYSDFEKIAVQRNGLIYILLSNSSEHMIVLRSDGKLAFERQDVSALVEHQGLTEDKVYIVSTKRSVKTIGLRAALPMIFM
ncbi:PQQ-binding-like beta-propeller repeat protein [Paenibacillus sp. LHD-38]|uniref:outer membrane protein assembly factor BamB family protein n=1 Tax=Paenibacillus sp. LHD-38 TaxID=3072143 RepID=UPI00280FA253|nr:PQQ-binding-like beta-propeller repeat protein [Paenibacillus sp. LHD-38]MDQ8738739.1 PQQ-binding-like beta-propeller repeat protein [Paenibacillus sp. LHD-38]